MSSPKSQVQLPERALMVREPYISFILMSRKRWELRGTPTNMRGRIGLIRSGSGLVIGECEIVGCEGPLPFEVLRRSENLSAEERQELKLAGQPPYLQKDGVSSKTYAWVVTNPLVYREPVPYRHPSGAITFVDLTKAGILGCTEASLSIKERQPRLF
jgi:hypothetical protein